MKTQTVVSGGLFNKGVVGNHRVSLQRSKEGCLSNDSATDVDNSYCRMLFVLLMAAFSLKNKYTNLGKIIKDDLNPLNKRKALSGPKKRRYYSETMGCSSW